MKKLIIGAASLMLCAGLQAQDFKINPSGYFENHGANVMVFSDVYPEGHQGGVTLVLNGDRRAAGGDVRFEISQGQWQGLPKMRKRVVDEAANEIRVTLSYPDSAKHMAGFNPMLYPDFAFGYTAPGRSLSVLEIDRSARSPMGICWCSMSREMVKPGIWLDITRRSPPSVGRNR